MALTTEEITMITITAFNYHIDEYNRKVLLPVILAEATLDELKEDGFIDAEYFDQVNEDDVFDDSLYHSVLDFRDILPTENLEYWDEESLSNADDDADLASLARCATRGAMRVYMQDRLVNQIISQPTEVNVKITVTVETTIKLEDGETVEDVKGRLCDIYLHGAGEEGYANKEDLGGDSTITIIG
jgi:hypothetical protein